MTKGQRRIMRKKLNEKIRKNNSGWLHIVNGDRRATGSNIPSAMSSLSGRPINRQAAGWYQK